MKLVVQEYMMRSNSPGLNFHHLLLPGGINPSIKLRGVLGEQVFIHLINQNKMCVYVCGFLLNRIVVFF